jgi:hypothetical protein
MRPPRERETTADLVEELGLASLNGPYFLEPVEPPAEEDSIVDLEEWHGCCFDDLREVA